MEDTAMVMKTPSADLRAGSRKTFEAGLIISLLLAIAAFKFSPEARVVNKIGAIETPPPIFLIIPPTTQPDMPPPPARPPVIIEAPPDEVLGDIVLDTDLNPDSHVPPPPPQIDGDEGWFEAVESPPKPADGYAALQTLVVYPEIAKRIGIEGTVVIIAYIEKDGTVSRTEVLKGIGFGCDEAAATAVAKTRFIPGLQREKPVRVKIAVPLRFRLSK